ncbi:DUF2306 domain-containing protein [Brevibacterium ihuae]|uniref:DUF2306 domain-containing protein n=1 Tax=Brevibacterium ihuae TaxID=1631743 RepID=UPI000C75DBF9|nr:DUF2306 domain-containing protein [Brevibacterium ihuae]
METTAIPPAVIVHAAAAFLVLILGPVNIIRPQRDRFHRLLGRSWVALMYLTCISSFFFGLEDGFTALHGLSVFTTATVTIGVWRIVRRDRIGHVANMVGSYIGTLIAFGFAAFLPQRLIWTTAVTDPIALLGFVGALLVIGGAWIAVLRARTGPTAGARSHAGSGPRRVERPAPDPAAVTRR